MTQKQRAVRNKTKTGDYPPGTTAQTLATIKTPFGLTALHDAARSGHLPPDTTATDLYQATTQGGWTALHVAAKHNHLPPNTTSQELANTQDAYGLTALHLAAQFGHLPNDATIDLLKTTHDRKGHSAWHDLEQHLQINPLGIFELPPQMFQRDHPTTIALTNKTITNYPSLKAKVTLWLAHVIAFQFPKTGE